MVGLASGNFSVTAWARTWANEWRILYSAGGRSFGGYFSPLALGLASDALKAGPLEITPRALISASDAMTGVLREIPPRGTRAYSRTLPRGQGHVTAEGRPRHGRGVRRAGATKRRAAGLTPAVLG